MKARPFAYARPASLAEAASLLGSGPGARALAGGQSLMPALVLRETEARLLVDVTGLRELRGIAVDGTVLHLGAGVPMWELERSPEVARHAPLLVQALRTVGAPAIRSRATLGGSVAWGDPTSQLPATLLALGASVVTTQRSLTVAELFAASRGSALAADELLTRIDVPSLATAGHGLRHVRRTHITWPVAGAAVLHAAELTRVGLYGAGPRPVAGEGATADEAIAAALAQVEPLDDEKAGAAYRARILPVLARRAAADAGASR